MLVLQMMLEPSEMRYGKQWNKWFLEAFHRNDIRVIPIQGTAGNTEPGPDQFQNPTDTFVWKFTQLKRAVNIISNIQSPVVVFLMDGWMPGTECFPYIANLVSPPKKIKVASFWHAGSYLGTDILNRCNQQYWSMHSEKSWLRIAHRIFLGSEYHKKAILGGSDMYCAEKFVVTGCPVEVPSIPIPTVMRMKKRVVWPHRISADKRPDIFDKLAAEPQFKDVDFVKTMEVSSDKNSYYHMLANADVAVSTAEHETFGISMMEATMLGCIPIVPKGLSYDELYGCSFTYKSYEDMVDFLAKALAPDDNNSWKRMAWDQAVSMEFLYNPTYVTDVICKEIKGMFNG